MQDRSRDIVEAIATHLKQWRETHAALFGEQPDRDFCQPAADFEKSHGLTGIAQQYNLPEGLSPRDLQSYAMLSWRWAANSVAAQPLEKITEVWNLLAAYNPELKKLVYDPQDKDTLYHMIMGVASAYNIDDIQHFIANPTSSYKGWEMEASPEFIKLTEVFNRCAAPERLKMEWVAAPATLQSIQGKILKKYGRDF